MGDLVGNGQLPVTGEDNHVTYQCPLLAISEHSGVGLTFRVRLLSFGHAFSPPSNQTSIFPFVRFAVVGFADDGYLD
jgi:hypothetical protein